jgi:hypothetical protein
VAADIIVDTTRFAAAMAGFTRTVELEGKNAARAAAEARADIIRARTPVDTGALRSTVGVVADGRGWGITYGAGLTYGFPVAAWRRNLAGSVAGTEVDFRRRMTDVVHRQVTAVSR